MPGIVESYSLKEVSLNVCFLLLAVVASGTVWNIVYNIFIHKLKDYPGPKLAGATRLYELYFDIIKKPFGQYIFEVERLHKVYGISYRRADLDCDLELPVLQPLQVLSLESIRTRFILTTLSS